MFARSPETQIISGLFEKLRYFLEYLTANYFVQAFYDKRNLFFRCLCNFLVDTFY